MARESRIVYVDNDPIVLSHARALLASDPAGATAYVDADLRDPQKILASAAQQLDFGRPVAVMLMAILQHLGDQDDPYGRGNPAGRAAARQLPGTVTSGQRPSLCVDGQDGRQP